jgi:hypothetical protein
MRDNEVRCLELKANVDIEHASKSTCRFCHLKFSRTTNAMRHMKTCPAKEEYREHLKKLIKKETPTTITNNITNITQINNVNIIVNPIGKENMDYITTRVLKKLWQSVKSDEEGVAKTLKLIHANKDHPENHSIIYTNLKHNSALVKTGDDYEYKNINEVLKDVTSEILDRIILHEVHNNLSQKIKEKYENVCEGGDVHNNEMNPKAKNLSKIALYDAYKNGSIKKPHMKSNQSCLT